MKIYINDLVKGHSDVKVKCLTFGLYTQVSDSGPLGPLVFTKLCPFFDLEFSCNHCFQRKRRCIVIAPAAAAAAAASCKTLTFSNISVITEDIYLKLRTVVHYQKGNPYQ